MDALRQLTAAFRTLVVLTVILGLAYPMAMVVVGRLIPDQTDGSLLHHRGTVVGSALLGQPADDPGWFQSRPSAVDWAGDSSGGSNLSPTSPELAEQMRERADALRAANPDAPGPIPPEAVTASASGLDPHISPEYARWQAPRVARARGVTVEHVQQLIDAHTSPSILGFLGTDVVNVPKLNLALAEETR